MKTSPKKRIAASLLTVLTLALVLVFSARAESSEGWEYSDYGLGGEGFCVIQTVDGGFAVAGRVQTVVGHGKTKFLLAKFNATGGLQWNKAYGGQIERWGRALAVIQTSDGGYAFTGAGTLFNFAKTDAEGNMQWNRTYVKPKTEVFWGQSLLQTSDGGYIIIGYTDTSPSDWVVKTDEKGSIQWNRTYGVGKADSLVKTGDSFRFVGSALSIVEENGGGYVIGGGSGVAKINANGRVVWFRTDITGPLIKTADGGHLLFGGSNVVGYLTKIGYDGNVEWNRTYSEIGSELGITFRQAEQAQDGGYVVCGLAGRHEQKLGEIGLLVVYYFAHVTKVCEHGEVEWSVLYTATGPPMPAMGNYPNSIKATSDGAYVFTGRRALKVWLVKVVEQPKLKPSHPPSPISPNPSPSPTPSQEPTTAPVTAPLQPENLTIASVVTGAIVSAGLLLYLRKVTKRLV